MQGFLIERIDNFNTNECDYIEVKDLLQNLKFTTVGYGVELFLCNKIVGSYNGVLSANLVDTIITSVKFELPA